MTRWLLYIQLFDFDLVHVPAEKHKVPDGLSRRKPSPLDSDDSDAEAYLDSFIGSSTVFSCSSVTVFSERFVHLGDLPDYDGALLFPTEYFTSWLEMQCSRLLGRGITYQTATPDTLDISYFATVPNNPEATGVNMNIIGNYTIDSARDAYKFPNSLIARSLLAANHTESYVCRDFFYRKVETECMVDCDWGGELISICISEYSSCYITEPLYDNSSDGESQHDDRTGYDLPRLERTAVTCVGHKFGKKDDESPELWSEILIFLRDGTLPPRCSHPAALKKFHSRARQFIHHDNRLWKIGKSGLVPRLVITDLARRQKLISEAHNEAGHRGRDATFKHLTDRYYWPNLFDDVAFFVVSCVICQLRSASRTKVPYSSTWNSTILRRFDLDTVHMPDEYGGKRFLLQATEPGIGWPEARASRKNDSASWAKFLFEEIICRFGCIPLFIIDGGSEFKGLVEILFKQYGVVAIVASPYSPHNNAVAERAHPTLVESLFRACGNDSSKWPLFLSACLLAMRCTTSRMTGFTSYYLLYGRTPLLAFDIADRTWDTLDWHTVQSTADLIGMRAQQIDRRDCHLIQGLAQQKALRKRAVDEFNEKHRAQLSTGEFKLGTWVLAHETWLDTQVGNKGALRWSGPFIVHEKVRDKTYRLRELDGTVIRELYLATRLKIFYYREHYQTVRSSFRGGLEIQYPHINWREPDAHLMVTIDGCDDFESYRIVFVRSAYNGGYLNPDLVWTPVLEHVQQTPGHVTRLRACPRLGNLTDPRTSHLLGILDIRDFEYSPLSVTRLDPESIELEQLDDWTNEVLPLRLVSIFRLFYFVLLFVHCVER
jgi:hypothetical protein